MFDDFDTQVQSEEMFSEQEVSQFEAELTLEDEVKLMLELV